MDTINLYNHFNYGDLFFSRSIIKALSENYNINYFHTKSDKVFSDLKNVNEIHGIPHTFPVHNSDISNGNINTWMGIYNFLYIKGPPWYCSYSRYMNYIKSILHYLNIPIKDNEYYRPEVNFENITNIEKTKNKFNELNYIYKNIILLCTGPVLSGQSHNFNFSNIIEKLSALYKDTLFLTTSNYNGNKKNVLSTCDLFPSLLDISYISERINLIIGRASGPYGYCLTKNNLKSKNKTFVCFCNEIQHASFYENFEFNLVWSNNYDENNMISIISKEIENQNLLTLKDSVIL